MRRGLSYLVAHSIRSARASRACASLLLYVLFLSVQGCAIRRPDVDFRGIRLNSVNDTSGRVQLGFNVYNPNRFELSLRRLSYRILLQDSTQVAEGERMTEATLRPGDSTQVSLPVTLQWSSFGAVAAAMMQTGKIPLRIIADMVVGTPVGEVKRSFDRQIEYSPIENRVR